MEDKLVNLSRDRSAGSREPGGGESAPAGLVLAARAGSAAAFEDLAAAYGPRLSRYLIVRLRSRHDAEDALQETLTAAWLGLPRLRDPERFWPWLIRIASRKIADSPPRGRELRLSEVPDQLVGGGDSGLVDITDALNRLPDRSRNVLLLRHVLGLSEIETAAVLRVPLGTVKARGSRARRALKAALDENGGTQPVSEKRTQ